LRFGKHPFLTLSAMISLGSAAPAAEQVCTVADGHQLTITTTNGDTVDGYCMSINVDEMAVTTKDRRVVKVARAALSRIQMQRSKNEQQLKIARQGFEGGLRGVAFTLCAAGVGRCASHAGMGSRCSPVLSAGRFDTSGDRKPGDQGDLSQRAAEAARKPICSR
jgi:hypothetical protein